MNAFTRAYTRTNFVSIFTVPETRKRLLLRSHYTYTKSCFFASSRSFEEKTPVSDFFFRFNHLLTKRSLGSTVSGTTIEKNRSICSGRSLSARNFIKCFVAAKTPEKEKRNLNNAPTQINFASCSSKPTLGLRKSLRHIRFNHFAPSYKIKVCEQHYYLNNFSRYDDVLCRYNRHFCLKANDKENNEGKETIDAKTTARKERGVLGSDKNLMEGWYTIPNAITIGRIASSPFISYFILTDQYEYAVYGFALASFSDFLDGYIAKTWNQQSLVGTFLDPLADKILIALLAIPLAVQDHISVYLVGLMFTRDALLIGGSFVQRALTKTEDSRFFDTDPSSTFHIIPSLLSKTNTVFQFTLLTAALTKAAWGFPPSIFMDILSGVVAFTTIGSGMEYLVGAGTKSKKKRI